MIRGWGRIGDKAKRGSLGREISARNFYTWGKDSIGFIHIMGLLVIRNGPGLSNIYATMKKQALRLFLGIGSVQKYGFLSEKLHSLDKETRLDYSPLKSWMRALILIARSLSVFGIFFRKA